MGVKEQGQEHVLMVLYEFAIASTIVHRDLRLFCGRVTTQLLRPKSSLRSVNVI